MVDQERDAPPEQAAGAPADADQTEDSTSDDAPTLNGGDPDAPRGAEPGVEETQPPPEEAAAAANAEPSSVDAGATEGAPAEEQSTDGLDAEATTAVADAADKASLDATPALTEAEETPAVESSEAPETAPDPVPPAQPAPGYLGALRQNTPPVGRWLRREARPRPPVLSTYTSEAPEWIRPEFEQQAVEAPSPPLGRSPGRLPAAILAILMSAAFLLFVLIEPTPTWLLLFGAIIAALGTDGVLRSIRHRIFEREEDADTVPHIFLPTLFALAIPLLIEENLESYWVIPAALIAGATFILVVLAEVPAEEAEDDEFRGRARFVSVAATYFVAFALFSLSYTFDLGLREALLVVALVSVLLAVELLREGEIDPLETLLLAGVVGVVVAEARWVLKYMPIDAYPAGLTLVLVFYFVTGMVHAYMTRHINRTVAAEYAVVTVLGLGLVIAARATGIA